MVHSHVVDRKVNHRHDCRDGSSKTTGALNESFVALDFVFEVSDSAGIAVPDERVHLCSQLGEIFENSPFEFGHKG